MPTGCKFPEHHSSSSGTGGSLVIAAAVVGLVALATTSTAAHVAGDLLEVVMWTAGVLVALVAVTIAAGLAWRRRHPERRAPWRRAEEIAATREQYRAEALAWALAQLAQQSQAPARPELGTRPGTVPAAPVIAGRVMAPKARP